MRVIQVDCVTNPFTLRIGRQGENRVTQVEFDVGAFVTEFGAGQPQLVVQRCSDISPYPVVLTVDGNVATWTVTATDTAKAGQAVDTTHLTDSVTMLTKEGFELRHEVFLHDPAPAPVEEPTEE